MDKLRFDEFEGVSQEKYLEKIRQELKDQSLEKIIEKNAVDGIHYSPVNLHEKKSIPDHISIPLSNNATWKTHLHVHNFWKNNPSLVKTASALSGSLAIDIASPKDIAAFLESCPSVPESLVVFPEFEFDSWLSKDHQVNLPTSISEGWIVCDPLLNGYNHNDGIYTPPDVTQFFEYLEWVKQHSNLKGITVQSCNIKDAGASIVQELAFTLNLINEYFVLANSTNIAADQIHNHLVISMAHHTDFFLEIAKYRAMRLLYRTLSKTHGVQSAASPQIHGRDSLLKLSRMDADLNLLRHTTGAMSAIVGGADYVECALHSLQTDDADNAVRLAGNTLLLLKHESDVGVSKDPAKGSHLIERLTMDIAEKSWAEFKRIEKNGGFKECMSSGLIPEEIAQSAEQKVADYVDGKLKMVGSNIFRVADDAVKYSVDTGLSNGFKPLILEQSGSL